MKYSDIEKLCELGLISVEQKNAITEHFRLSPHAARNYLLIAFSSLGGLLVLAGIILLVSANWAEIPPSAKQLVGGALMLACWAVGLKFVLGKNPRPILGESLCMVGAGLWLANIALYGQIYQISSEPSNAIGVWFLGIFLFPRIVRLRGVFAMSLVAATIWLGCKCEEFRGPDDVFYFYFLALFAAISALGIFVSNLNEKTRERFRGYGPIAAWTAFPALILTAQFSCYGIPDFSPETALALVPATALLLTALLASFAKKLSAGGIACACVLGLFPIVPFVLCALADGNVSHSVIRSLMMLALFGYGVLSMVFGAMVARKFYVNTGTLMILLAALAAVVELVGSLTQSGFALIVAGTLLLGFGFFLERQRRKITAKIQAAER